MSAAPDLTNADRNTMICDLRRRDWSPREIANKLGISRSAVIGVLFRAGLTDSGHPQAAGRGADYDPAFKRAVVAAARASNMYQASKAWGVPFNSVKAWVRGLSSQ